ncbi:unnamed protein product [Cladocopium goreaui]|uniref:Uncharacterized protein n=1 Tax=Cladocopium goreaui TaxID=2562237 RepID=A0A9P1DVT6_9DINO|nr:unnamed protein product [Cladocopium goreaui]
MFITFVVLTLVEVLAVEQGRHVLVRRHEALDGFMQQDDAEPQSQAAKVSKAWDSLPYSSFAGKKDSKAHPEDNLEKPTDQGHEHEAKVQSMEVSPTGEAHLQPSAMNPVRAVPQSLAPEAAPNHPPSDPHLSSGKFGADVPSASHVTAEALAVAVAAEDAAQWTGSPIRVSPAGNQTARFQEKAARENKTGWPARLVQAAQVPMVSAPVMSAVPAAPVVAEAATTAAATTVAATTAAPTTAAATTAAATTAAATTGAVVGMARTTEEEEAETTEEKEEKEPEEEEEEEEEENEDKKGAGQASFVEQHFVLLAAGGVGVVTLLVIGMANFGGAYEV